MMLSQAILRFVVPDPSFAAGSGRSFEVMQIETVLA
jgi:hypothetical protein